MVRHRTAEQIIEDRLRELEDKKDMPEKVPEFRPDRPLTMAERIAIFEQRRPPAPGSIFEGREPLPFGERGADRDPIRATGRGIQRFVLEPVIAASEAVAQGIPYSIDELFDAQARGLLLPPGGPSQVDPELALLPLLQGDAGFQETGRALLEAFGEKSIGGQIATGIYDPTLLAPGLGLIPLRGAPTVLKSAPGRLGFAPQSLLTERPPTFQPAQAIREATPLAEGQLPPRTSVQGGLGIGEAPQQVGMDLGGRGVPLEPLIEPQQVIERGRLAEEARAGQQVLPEVEELSLLERGQNPDVVEQARFNVDAARAEFEAVSVRGEPAPKFGTRERAEFDNIRRQASAEGKPIIPKKRQVADARQKLRATEANLKEVELNQYVEPRVPDPPPADVGVPPARIGDGALGQPPSGGGVITGPPEIPPLRGRADRARFVWERPDEAAIDLHVSAITNEERRAGLVVTDGSRALKNLGLGRTIRGKWTPRPEDIPKLDEFFDALHHPSEVAAGTRQIPEGMEGVYRELRNLTDWEEAARLDFDPEMATIKEYFSRGWKPPEGAFVSRQGTLVQNPSFKKPRSGATYREMRELGFEPLSWNPFEQWRISRMQGVKYRQQMELVDYLKGLGDEYIRPDDAFQLAPEGWRTPEVGPAFEGKPFAFMDAATGQPKTTRTGRWIVLDEIASGLENTYGKPATLRKVRIGDKNFDILKVIDALTFIPKRIKLFGSFFQQVDFLTRSGIGGTSAAVNALRTGHPIQSVQHLVGMPGSAREIIGSFFSPNWRENLLQRLDDATPIHSSRPGVNVKAISESGLNISDPTIFGRDPLGMDEAVRQMVEEGVASKVIKAGPRAIREIERMSRQGLFGGVYPAAILNDVRKNIAPQMMRQYGHLADEQLNRAIAHAANVRYSSLPANQSVVQNRVLRETLTRGLFSLNENEGLLRQFTKLLPVSFRFSKDPRKVIKASSGFSKFWADHWLGAFIFLTATANVIHFASTGKPLPFNRYRPISGDKWGPLPFGYNTDFASPDIPLTGKGGTRLMLDLVGQMDTAFRVLNPFGFIGSRESVPIRAFVNQAEAEDFYGKPIDEVGPGGVFSRTTQLIQDLGLPIGIGQAGVNILAGKVEGADPFVSHGEEKIGVAGQLIQALGLNVRGETLEDAVKRRNPGFDQMPPTRQKQLTQEVALDMFGPKTRREKERFQERIWDLFPPTDKEREAFKTKMDREFNATSTQAPIQSGDQTAEQIIEDALRELVPAGR